MVNIGGFGAAIIGQAAIGMLVSVHLDYRLALTPLLALAAWGAVQTVRHASLPLLMEQLKGLILSGGKGTRLRPITYTSAKQLVPVANKPVLFYGIEAMAAAGHPRGRDHHRAGDRRRDPRGGRRRLPVRRRDHVHPAVRAARARARGADRRAVPGHDPFVMYLGDNLLQGGIEDLVATFRHEPARGADPAHQGPGPAELRRRRARTRTAASRGWWRSRPSRRPTSRWSASTCSRRASTRPRSRSSRPAAASWRSPTRSSGWSTPARPSSRTSCAAGGRTPAASTTCSKPTA